MNEPQPNRTQRREMEKAARRKPVSKPRAKFQSHQDAYAHFLKPMALLSDCRTYEEREIASDLIRIRTAFDRLVDGTADVQDFQRVGVAFNIAKVRAIEISEALADELEKAQESMMACKARYQKQGRFGFDGKGLEACRYALEAHEEILANSSPKQMENAMIVMHKAIQMQTKHGQHLAELLLQ